MQSLGFRLPRDVSPYHSSVSVPVLHDPRRIDYPCSPRRLQLSTAAGVRRAPGHSRRSGRAPTRGHRFACHVGLRTSSVLGGDGACRLGVVELGARPRSIRLQRSARLPNFDPPGAGRGRRAIGVARQRGARGSGTHRSSAPVYRVWPPSSTAIARTKEVWPNRVVQSFVLRSHTLTLLSEPPE